MVPQASSFHWCLHAILVASLLAVSVMYLQLRHSYTQLQLSCQAGSRQPYQDGGASASCPVTCFDYCRNGGRTDNELPALSSKSTLDYVDKFGIAQRKSELIPTTSPEQLMSEKITSSEPAVFQTLETASVKKSVKNGELHIDLDIFGASSSQNNDIAYSGFEITSALRKDDDEVASVMGSSSVFEDTMLQPMLASSVPGFIPRTTEYDTFYGEKVKKSEPSVNIFTSRSVATVPSTSVGKEDGRPLQQQSYLQPTSVPVLEISASSTRHQQSSTRRASLYQDVLPDLTELAGTESREHGHHVVFTENINTQPGFCESGGCLDGKSEQAGRHIVLKDTYGDGDFHGGDWDDDEDDVDDDDDDINGDEDTGFRLSDQGNVVKGQSHSGRSGRAMSSGKQARLLFHPADDQELARLSSHGTSLWCETGLGDEQSCRFHNLCFKTQERDFVFVVGEGSVLEQTSVAELSGEPHLAVNLSAVPDHKAHTFPLVFIPADSLPHFNVAVMRESSFIMSRFKPDNIMHVLHDDILPLTHTLHKRGLWHHSGRSHLRLVLADLFDPGDNADLYSSLFSSNPISLLETHETADLICFADAYIGLSRSTLWYQYGFFKPQGPLVLANSSDVVENVHRATDYLAEIFQTACLFCSGGNYLVLLSRKDNRVILNEGELTLSLVRSTKLKVMSVSLETHSVGDIISIVKSSKGIVGMHGSLLIFGLFLQPGSVFIELFPYAVNPSKYTPFKTFCDLPGTGIVYRSWSNLDPGRTVGFPHRDPELGGLQHLTSAARAAILGQTEVPDHLCCEDPSWLYHIYQDTEVDVGAVVTMTMDALTKAASVDFIGKNEPSKPTSVHRHSNDAVETVSAKVSLSPGVGGANGMGVTHESDVQVAEGSISESCDGGECSSINVNKDHTSSNSKLSSVKMADDLILRPSQVQDLTCQLHKMSSVSGSASTSRTTTDSGSHSFKLVWTPPWNLQFIRHTSVSWEVLFQETDADTGRTVLLDSGSREFSISPGTPEAEYHVWVRAVLDKHLGGPYRYVRCKLAER